MVKAAGLGAFRVPAALGGAGASFRDLFVMLLDLAEADCNVAHLLRNHYRFVEQQLVSADAELRDRHLRRVVEGSLFNSAAGELVPHAVGSPEWYRFGTTLVEDGDGFRLTGTKYYTTGTMFCDYVSVLATREGQGLVSATIPVAREGVECMDDWDGMGQQHTASGTTRFDNVRVEAEEVFDTYKLLDGVRPPNYYDPLCQLWLQAVVAGELRNVVSDAVRVLQTRKRGFSHGPTNAVTEDPLLQETIGHLAAAAFAAETMVLSAAEALDAAYESNVDNVPSKVAVVEAQLRCALVKIHLDGVATDAATKLFDVAGASAAKQEFNLDRHWRNIRTLVSHNPTAYKAQAVGAHLVLDEPFPDNGYF
jgi:alkylation response protein AidB-like acyl-CoA dehydrogenase